MVRDPSVRISWVQGLGAVLLGPAVLVLATAAVMAGEDWPQLKYDSRHSGDVPGRSVTLPLGLVAAAPLSDAVFTAPVVAGGRVYVVDGAGVAWCLRADNLEVVWRFAASGGPAACNNVSSPAGGRLVPALRHDGRFVLRAGRGRRPRGPPDPLRRADPQRARWPAATGSTSPRSAGGSPR